MKFVETALPGCFVIGLEAAHDDRGYFVRTFCAREFAAHGLNPDLVQTSLSFNLRKGTLRALHFQAAPAMEDKLVRCDSGTIFDVAVDLRRGSPTFARWFGVELSASAARQLYIPKGFAHGFQTLTDNALVSYAMAQFYEPGRSSGVAWDDPDIAVAWPLSPVAQSANDLALPRLADLDPSALMPYGGQA